MDAEPELHVIAPGSPALRRIYSLLADQREERTPLVEDVRGQMASGRYLSDEKLNLAIYRMLKDALR